MSVVELILCVCGGVDLVGVLCCVVGGGGGIRVRENPSKPTHSVCCGRKPLLLLLTTNFLFV